MDYKQYLRELTDEFKKAVDELEFAIKVANMCHTNQVMISRGTARLSLAILQERVHMLEEILCT